MQVNDLIFKELIKRGYSLEGKTRVWNIADSKLWYLTPKQAQAYLDLENSGEYLKAINKKQSDNLITSNAKLILKNIGKEKAINVVDLGCGDGKKALELIEAFEGKIKVRYCPIDISGYMVKKARETFSKVNVAEIVEFQYNISDFENLENITPLLQKGEFKKTVFLLLGNTLGNFEINELMYTIRSSMKDEDLLLVDTALADEKIHQKAKAQSKNKMVDEFLKHIPLQLGLEKNEAEYSARFKNSRIEFFYTIMKDKKVEFQEKTVYFNKGDQIIVAVAYKFELEELKSYFNVYFREAEFVVSKDRSQVCILITK